MPRYAPQSLPGMPPNAPEPPRLHQNLGTIVVALHGKDLLMACMAVL